MYTLGAGNRLVSWTGGSFGYDAAGNVTNIARGSTNRVLSWNGQYQLVSVTSATLAVEYAYDPHGRRLRTVEDGVTNYHIYSGVHVVADIDSGGHPLRTYVPGPGVDHWLAMTVHTGATDKTCYYLTDHLGTVHALTDDDGIIVESYRYDPWGRVLGVWDGSGQPLAESAVGNRILWQGREYSWKTGLYYFRARWYDPITGRWLSNDPIGISGGLNQYVFCANNPVNCVDPMGLFTNAELIGIRDRQMGNYQAAIADAVAAQNALTQAGNLSAGREFALTTSKVTGATATAVSAAWLLGAPGLSTTVAGTTTMSTGGTVGVTVTKVTLGAKGALASSAAVTATPYVLKGGNWLRGRTMDRKIQAIDQWLQSALDAADSALAAAKMAQGLLNDQTQDDTCK